MVNKQDQVEAELVLHKLRVYTSPIRCLIGAMCPLTQHIGDSHLHFSTGACCVCVCVCSGCLLFWSCPWCWSLMEGSAVTNYTPSADYCYWINIWTESNFLQRIFNLFVQINNWNFFKERKKKALQNNVTLQWSIIQWALPLHCHVISQKTKAYAHAHVHTQM